MLSEWLNRSMISESLAIFGTARFENQQPLFPAVPARRQCQVQLEGVSGILANLAQCHLGEIYGLVELLGPNSPRMDRCLGFGMIV